MGHALFPKYFSLTCYKCGVFLFLSLALHRFCSYYFICTISWIYDFVKFQSVFLFIVIQHIRHMYGPVTLYKYGFKSSVIQMIYLRQRAKRVQSWVRRRAVKNHTNRDLWIESRRCAAVWLPAFLYAPAPSTQLAGHTQAESWNYLSVAMTPLMIHSTRAGPLWSTLRVNAISHSVCISSFLLLEKASFFTNINIHAC